MTEVKYDYELQENLRGQRADRLKAMQDIVNRAQSEGRDLRNGEAEAVEAGAKEIERLDADLRDQSRAMVRTVFGSPRDPDAADSKHGFLSLRTPGFKSDLTAHFGRALGTPGVKALVDAADPYTTIALDPTPFRLEQAPTSFLEILPAVQRPVVYRYMQQTSRTNNAAPVAIGGTKPTSSYALEPVDGRLHVIAHISEPMDKYVLQDGPSLTQFVQMEMADGLHQAVEAEVIGGDGTGEHLTGIAETSGIQTQDYNTSALLTMRSAKTKVEVLSFSPYYYAVHPLDWEALETEQLTAGQFVLNAEGQRSGLPVDSAARKLWGVPVALSTGLTQGTAYLLSENVVQVVTDGAIASEWSPAVSDDFAKNQVRLRVEGRFDLAVTRPSGVVEIALTAA